MTASAAEPHAFEEDLVEVLAAGDVDERADRRPPAASIGSTNIVMPACGFGASGSVRASSSPKWASGGVRRPHLLAVDHPFVAVADGAGPQRGEVGSGVGLGEQLAPLLVGTDQRRAGSAASAPRSRTRSSVAERQVHADAAAVGATVRRSGAAPASITCGGRGSGRARRTRPARATPDRPAAASVTLQLAIASSTNAWCRRESREMMSSRSSSATGSSSSNRGVQERPHLGTERPVECSRPDGLARHNQVKI